ncbi:MAG TPA: SAM-dependent methyltransferase [Methylomirabilota bacterium]|nr:SAM-dependent methyltransferase [Methylomirabilota bacterium]
MWMLREIRRRGGEVGFRDFMELALYHPEHGYYAARPSPWGRGGDYLTAPTASGWYGATLAHFLGQLAELAGSPLRLVDVAAGDGSFLAAVLEGLGGRAAAVLVGVTAVDRVAVMRDRAASRLAGAAVPFEVAASPPASDGAPTVVHASELYDAFPVHRVRQGRDGLEELAVAVDGGVLEWRARPAGPELVAYLQSHGVVLEPGQLAEIGLATGPYHGALLESVGQGLALVLDYGYEAVRLYDPRGRRHGSLVSYSGHRLDRELLDRPGERDLTAHVNWDDLRQAAARCGWRELALLPLAELLVRAGLGVVAEARGLGMAAELDAATVAARQELKRLLDPEGMGSDLKMLIQGRGPLADVAAGLLRREP